MSPCWPRRLQFSTAVDDADAEPLSASAVVAGVVDATVDVAVDATYYSFAADGGDAPVDVLLILLLLVQLLMLMVLVVWFRLVICRCCCCFSFTCCYC